MGLCCASHYASAEDAQTLDRNVGSEQAQNIMQSFKRADKDGSKHLEFGEIQNLLLSMNYQLPKKEARAMFDRFHVSGGPGLSFQEFTKFFLTIQSLPDVHVLFEKVAGQKGYINATDLRSFHAESQDQVMSFARAQKLIDRYSLFDSELEVPRELPEPGMLLRSFTKFLCSIEDNGLFAPEHSRTYQDMTLPLSFYYIASSHNSYLEGNQISGKSSAAALIRALRLGCRVIELDCYDGATADEPVVYHGNTMTSRLLFSDAIGAIKSHAFDASEYPVIITLENHCSLHGQQVQASILRSKLADSLFIPHGPPPREFASPEMLKRMVLIRDKPGSESTPKHLALMELMYIRNVKCPLLNLSCVPHASSSSFSESKMKKLVEAPEKLIEYTSVHLARVYPKGNRVDSSNYDPMLGWNVGCQIVALNYQDKSRATWLNQAKFQEDNGGCGYVLKPEYLTEVMAPRAEPQLRLQITIYSGHMLPKPMSAEKGEVIDPYVIVEVAGAKEDCVVEKTPVIDDNGYNPVWESTFSFNLRYPEHAVLLFTVMDKDVVGSDFIGQYGLPVHSLRSGYRTLPLRSESHAPLRSAFLFCHVSVGGGGVDVSDVALEA